MDTQKNKVRKSQTYQDSKLYRSLNKAVAVMATACFIFSGIPVPTSYADNTPIIRDENQRLVATITLEQANAKTVDAISPIPSGVSIKEESPLSRSEAADSETKLQEVTLGDMTVTVTQTIQDGTSTYTATIKNKDGEVLSQYEVKGVGELFQPANLKQHSITLKTIDGKEVKIVADGRVSVTEFLTPDKTEGWGWLNRTVTYELAGGKLRKSTESYTIPLVRYDDQGSRILIPASERRGTGTLQTISYYYDANGVLASRNIQQFGKDTEGRTANFYLTEVYNAQGEVVKSYFSLTVLKIVNGYTASYQRLYDMVELQSHTVVAADPLPPFGLIRSMVAVPKGSNEEIVVGFDANKIITVEKRTIVYPLPEGWTRAASNPSYAFQLSDNAGNEVLKVQNLITGQITTVYDKPSSQEDIWGAADTRADVSSDGKYMVFSTRTVGGGSKAYVYELGGSGPAKEFVMATDQRWVPNAPGNAYHFSAGEIQIDLVNTPAMTSVGVYKINTTTWQGTLYPNVPSGWTRVPDLPNLAYQTNTNGVVSVMDLPTGTVTDKPFSQNWYDGYHTWRNGLCYAMTSEGLKEIYYVNSRSNTSISIYNPATKTWSFSYSVPSFSPSASTTSISSNGQYLTVANQMNRVSVMTLSGTASLQSILIPQADGLGVPWIGETKFISSTRILVTVADGSNRQFYVDIKPDGSLSLVPVVPAGWARAVSNANFAFKTVTSYVANGIYNVSLKVLNLLTGAEQTVASGQTFPYAHPEGLYDVSPDGSTVIYGFHNMQGSTGSAYSIILKQLSDLSKTAALNGQLASIRFENGKAILVTGGGAITPSYTVRLQDLAVVATTYALNNPAAAGIKYNPQAHLVTQAVTLNYTGYIRVYDTTNGLDQMTLLLDRKVTTGYPSDQITLVDIYQTPGGRGIVSYATDTYAPSLSYDYQTVVLDPRTGAQLALNGRATKVTYDGATARYEITHRDGTKGVVFVNLNTLKVVPPPVPQGWTRAASNANFALKVEFIPTPGAPQEVLYLLNLSTGKEQVIARSPAASGYALSNVYDVSPDGKFVVYEKSGMYGSYDPVLGLGRHMTVYIQEIANPAHQIKLDDYVGYGSYAGERLSMKSIKFKGDNVKITRESHGVTIARIVNLKTGAIRPGIPAGWTAVPSMPNLACQIISGTRLKIMNLTTGGVSTMSYTVTPTSKKGIYLIKVGGMKFLGRYDSVTKKWTFYKA